MYQSPVALRPETTRDTLRPRRPVVERIAGWSSRHRKTAVFGWLLLVAVLFMAAQAVGTKNLPSYDPGQAGRAERVLHQAAPGYYGSAAEIVLIQARVPGETFAGDASMRQAARQLVTALAALPKSAAGIGSPLTLTAGHGDSLPLVSADGRSALVTFVVPGSTKDQDQAVAADQRAVAAVQARHPDLLVAETGDASVLRAIDNSLDFRQAEATSIPITLILLLVVFGALVAAGIPVLLAVSAVMAALSLVTISSHWLPIGNSTAEVVLIVGMAVGVDYSLFYLRREREERAKGRALPESLRIAAGTSGRAILVSGVTVMIAMAGLFLTGIDQFTGIALGTIAVVGIAVAGAYGPARAAVLAGAAGRPGPASVPGPQPRGRPPVPAVGRARAPRGRPSGDLGRRRRGGLARAGRAGAGHAAGGAGRGRAAWPGRRADHERDPPGVPAGPRAGRGGRDRPGRHWAAGDGRGRRVAGARGGRRPHPRTGDRHRGRQRGRRPCAGR